MSDKKCSCCGGTSKDVLFNSNLPLTRKNFLHVMAAGALGLSTLAQITPAQASEQEQILKGTKDLMVIDTQHHELRISAIVTKDVSKPSVGEWGKRGQAWFGVKGGKMESFFVFTTDVPRTEINKACGAIGIRHRRQIGLDNVKAHKGLKATTSEEDYLQGDPLVVVVRFERDGQILEAPLESFIREKIKVEETEIEKPYTPHFVYHGTAEEINYPSGCVVCPSDCPGGIITDNVMPLLTMDSDYLVDWDKMPPPGTRVEIAIKSIYGPQPMSTIS